MLLWKIVVIWTLLLYCKGVHGTKCSEAATRDNIDVIRMCEEGSINTYRVVIDTYDTGAPDVYNCTCTARQYFTSSHLISLTKAFKFEEDDFCGSAISIETPGKVSLRTECKMLDQPYSDKRSLLDFVLSRTNESSPWKSGYCLLLETDYTKWNISCFRPEGVATKVTTSTTPSPVSTTSSSSSSSSSAAASTTETISTGTQGSSPNSPEISTNSICSPKIVEVVSPASVIVPIVISVLIAAVTTIANVILYRRRLAYDKKPDNPDHALQPTGSIVYDSIDPSRLEPPHTYADTTAGRMYANTASGTAAGGMYANTSSGSNTADMHDYVEPMHIPLPPTGHDRAFPES